MTLFKKGPKYRIPSRIEFTKCRSIVEHFRLTVNDGVPKKAASQCLSLTTGKMSFYALLTSG